MNSIRQEGLLFIVSAPSGTGKTSLSRELIDFFPDLRQSVSFTTRPMRAGEIDGRDYHFVSPEVFDGMVAEGAFAEWAEVHGNRYGTALRTLEEARLQGADILLDIDCQGASQIRRSYDRGIFIFILPPSFEELERRLKTRNTDAPDVINRRIINARREVLEAAWYDYVVVNDDFAHALATLRGIVLTEHARTGRVLPLVAERFGITMDIKQ